MPSVTLGLSGSKMVCEALDSETDITRDETKGCRQCSKTGPITKCWKNRWDGKFSMKVLTRHQMGVNAMYMCNATASMLINMQQC